ncbi:hypothetical protein JKP88DRAFT_279209 [Tribonema minus]|uniref:Uncharacterized protein n=1 Tax=Tribonema minus TaxID=303371 RepID=A0A835YT12_9STRA|nr:hypothetical protein JKP88DRAFT_279209 [Tribonema minus]
MAAARRTGSAHRRKGDSGRGGGSGSLFRLSFVMPRECEGAAAAPHEAGAPSPPPALDASGCLEACGLVWAVLRSRPGGRYWALVRTAGKVRASWTAALVSRRLGAAGTHCSLRTARETDEELATFREGEGAGVAVSEAGTRDARSERGKRPAATERRGADAQRTRQ